MKNVNSSLPQSLISFSGGGGGGGGFSPSDATRFKLLNNAGLD